MLFDEGKQRGHDFHFRDGDDIIQIFLAEGIGKFARCLDRTAVGYGIDTAQRRYLSFGKGVFDFGFLF